MNAELSGFWNVVSVRDLDVTLASSSYTLCCSSVGGAGDYVFRLSRNLEE